MIELILVMAVLTIALSVTAPALANFFRGRTLDSEARRLLALTREGEARAVSQGMPTDLWLDTEQNAIGLEAEPSYEPEDPKAVQISLSSDVRLSVDTAKPLTDATRQNQTLSFLTPNPRPVLSRHPNLPRIRFLPDGSVDDTSPQVLRLTGSDGTMLFLVEMPNRSAYEIRSQVE